ncbi:DUF2298 domain-containing protein [Haloarchaeobius sp. TZWWS8]|uniref:DUF2298 domain-containing protein n=1 Tax=Haloarchaeobius sp. TZWWS8 TaxID=3446121 RepID=UPI003EBFA389
MSPIVVWLIVLALCTLAGLPLAAALFPRSPDRGLAFALPLSLAVVTLVAYWLGQVTFGRTTVAVAVVALAGSSVLASRAAPSVPRRIAIEPVAVFAVAFAAMLAVRLAHPAVVPQGGEKFLDYGLLQSVLRADALPPADFWFAGERVRYYYGGHLVAGVVSMLAGVEARYAYNLAMPTFFACIATSAYGLAGWLATENGHSRRLGGSLGVVLVAFGNNLAPAARLAAGLLPEPVGVTYGRAIVAGIRLPYPQAFTQTVGLSNWSLWNTRYVLDGTLVVSPSWEYVNGDLHAHVIAPVFTLLVVALCLSWWTAPDDDPTRWLVLAAAAPLAGLLALTNLWSVPTACGLVFLTVACSSSHPLRSSPLRSWAGDRRVHRELSRLGSAAVAAVAVGLGGVITAAPFLLDHTPISRGVGFLPDRSALVPFVLAWGLFVVPFAVVVLPRLREWAGTSRAQTAAVAALALVSLAGLLVDFAALTLLAPLVAGGWLLARQRGSYTPVLIVAGAGLLLVVEVAYARVWPLNSLVRWNTVYKVSMQAWVLWGVAGGAVLAGWASELAALVGDRTTCGGDVSGTGRGDSGTLDGNTERLRGKSETLRGNAGTVAKSLLLVVLVCSTCAFPVLVATETVAPGLEHRGVDGLTLDSTAYVEHAAPDEDAAIEWLEAREGTPTILTEGSGDLYQWHSAPATLSGLPTVAGWKHEAGYRGRAAFDERLAVTRQMYVANWSTSARLLAEYDVRYVYVGPDERTSYGASTLPESPEYGIHDFDAKQGVTVAHRSGKVTIYEIDEEEMCAADGVDCPEPDS